LAAENKNGIAIGRQEGLPSSLQVKGKKEGKEPSWAKGFLSEIPAASK